MALKSQSMPEDTETDIREVQTATLRGGEANRGVIIVSVGDAIRAAGLEEGDSFRFVPNSVEEIGMLAAIGSKESADGRSDRFARSVRKEGAGETLRIVIPRDALSELLDPDEIDWEDPPEVNVWAGDRLIAFELANPEERTVSIDRDADQEDSEDDS